MQTNPEAPEPLYTDADGVPTLFDVVLPGDALRHRGYRLPATPERPGRAEDELAAVRILQEQLREALRKSLHDAVVEAITRRHPQDR